MSDQQYDLDELDWIDPPAEYNFFGSVVYLYPDDEDRGIDIYIEYSPISKETVLSSKVNLSPAEDLVEWVGSDNPKDWEMLDRLFGEGWKNWLDKQSEDLRELYEKENGE